MKALTFALLAGLAVALAAPLASAELFERLPATARAQLQRGEQVVRTQDMEESKWPAVTVYQLVSVPPEAAAAIFTNFAAQPGYLRECCGLVQAVVRDPAVGGDPRVQRVFYELEVPVFANERYELIETLSRGEGGSYSVTWKKVGGGGRSEDIVGRAYFEPHGNGTLFLYYNYVKMNAFGAGAFSGQSVDRTRTTVDAMVKHMQEVYAAGGRRLRDDIERLRGALGS
jgi:hypothetical protein